MKLVWAQYALEDRRAIYDHIEADDPRAAALVDARIADAVARLIDFPASGRPGRARDVRELVVGRTSCIVAYRVVGETVRILRILHGAQLWPDDLPIEGEAHTCIPLLAREGEERAGDHHPVMR